MNRTGMFGRLSLILPLGVLIFMMTFAGCGDDDPPITGGGQDTTTFPFLASDFDSAESCRDCHPDQYADWSGSMHAYAVKDPVWLAIRAVGQSAYAGALDQGCVRCHSPIGSRSGETPWGPLDTTKMSAVTKEGIGCDLCHTITSLSDLANGGVEMAPSDTKFGTITNPVPNSVHKSEFSGLFRSSEFCGSCHDLVTDAGFELETTYREWRSGGFALTGKTCNDCHMPSYQGQATPGGPVRTLHRHTMVGVDIALIDFPFKQEQFDLVDQMLKSALTMNVTIPSSATAGDTVDLSISITNDKTGHSVPSGVPFNRQMWLDITITDDLGTVIYSTGQLDANGDLLDETSEFPERDPDLFNVRAQMYQADGLPTGATWDATSLYNPSIKPGETKVVPYSFVVPAGYSGNLSADVKLRFRSFAPRLFRDLNLDALLPIPIFDMNQYSQVITIP